jgi:hypothetical protein
MILNDHTFYEMRILKQNKQPRLKLALISYY